MKWIAYVCLLCLVMLLIGCSRARDRSFYGSGDGWTAGFAKMETMPSDVTAKPYYLAGFSANKPATGVLDPMFVRAVWLDDNSGRGGVVLVTVDCIGLLRADILAMLEDLDDFQSKTGCRAIHIISTHTHAGIDTLGLWGPYGQSGKDPDFMDMLHQNVVQTVKKAYENRTDGHLYFGSVRVEGMQRDSREPEVYNDTLTRFRFASEDDDFGLQLIVFGAHPEALRSENTLVSADFPCYMGRAIQRETGDEFMFFPGSIGGLITTPRLRDERGVELPLAQNVVKTGEILAEAALSIENERALPPSLNIQSETCMIPMENRMLLLMSFLDVISARPVPGGGSYNLSVETVVTYAEIGGVKVLMVPGELFPELAYGGVPDDFQPVLPDVSNPRTLARIVGDDDIVVIGLADDEIGYIVPPNDFAVDEHSPYLESARDRFGRRHYEETVSIGPKAAQNIADAFERIMQRIRQQPKS